MQFVSEFIIKRRNGSTDIMFDLKTYRDAVTARRHCVQRLYEVLPGMASDYAGAQFPTHHHVAYNPSRYLQREGPNSVTCWHYGKQLPDVDAWLALAPPYEKIKDDVGHKVLE